MSKISSVEIEYGSKNIAQVKLVSGETLSISWGSLRNHWEFLVPDEDLIDETNLTGEDPYQYIIEYHIEYIHASYTGDKCVFSITHNSDQGGIVAVYHVSELKWIQVSEGEYTQCAILLEDIGFLIKKLYVHNYVTPAYHAVQYVPFRPTYAHHNPACVDDQQKIITEKERGQIFDETDLRKRIDFFTLEITQSCFLHDQKKTPSDAMEKFGPSGIFYSKNKGMIYVHDTGGDSIEKHTGCFFAIPVSSFRL